MMAMSMISFSQACGLPLGSSGGQQAAPCNPVYTIHFQNNSVHPFIGIWWNYFTNCTEHLIPSTDVLSGSPYIPNGGAWYDHIIYKYQSTLSVADNNCNPSNCVNPCYLVLEFPPFGSGNFILPTNVQFPGPPSSTLCNPSVNYCLTITPIGPNEYNIVIN